MKILAHALCVIVIMVVLGIFQVTYAEPNPSLIRVRMEKELSEFPKISGSFLKKISENVWHLRGEHLVFNERVLPQNNFITKKESGKFDIISVLDFNEYLSGVVASEMPRGWPLEALKVQAVVARSYALARIKERKNKVFHIESDQTDQVYNVSNVVKVKQAVAETEGIVLYDSSGAVLKAYYHSDCGGETVSATKTWGDRAIDAGTAKDPWCAQKKSNQWEFEVSKSEFKDKLGVSIIESTNYFNQRKMQSVLIGKIQFSIQKMREIFGFNKIRSSADVLEISGDRVKIKGQGFGHGVGLCQWGALAQVKLGKTYLQIIKHYYPRAQIIKDSNYLSLNISKNINLESVSN